MQVFKWILLLFSLLHQSLAWKIELTHNPQGTPKYNNPIYAELRNEYNQILWSSLVYYYTTATPNLVFNNGWFILKVLAKDGKGDDVTVEFKFYGDKEDPIPLWWSGQGLGLY